MNARSREEIIKTLSEPSAVEAISRLTDLAIFAGFVQPEPEQPPVEAFINATLSGSISKEEQDALVRLVRLAEQRKR
jgi:hypothetical protein